MRAFIVIGAESSGTRLLTRILISGGCHGSAEHVQPFDTEPFGDLDPVVIRRSIPHNGEWDVLQPLLDKCSGREVTAVIISRESSYVARSQVLHGYAKSMDEAYDRIRRAHRYIDMISRSIPYQFVSYEALVKCPIKVQIGLLNALLLAVPNTLCSVYDGNSKYRQAA